MARMPFVECDIRPYRYRGKHFIVAVVLLFLHYLRGAVWIQSVDPSVTTLVIRSTGNQLSNCDPIAAMFLYRFRQFWDFCRCSFSLFPLGKIQWADPSSTPLFMRSTLNQLSNYYPILAIFLYRIRQFCVCFWFPTATLSVGINACGLNEGRLKSPGGIS
jgi:hypothetical protein